MYDTIEKLKKDFIIKDTKTTITLIEFKDTKLNVIIPEKIEEKKIIKVKSLCFIDSNLKRIKFEGLIEFEENTFIGCNNLLEIKLNDIIRNKKIFIKDCINLRFNEGKELSRYLYNLGFKVKNNPYFELKNNQICFKENVSDEDLEEIVDFRFFNDIDGIVFKQYLFSVMSMNKLIKKIILPNKMTKLSNSSLIGLYELRQIEGIENIEIFEDNCLYNSKIDLNLIRWKNIKELGICPFGPNKSKIEYLYLGFIITNHSFSYLNINKLEIADGFSFSEANNIKNYSPFYNSNIKELIIPDKFKSNKFLKELKVSTK